MEMELWYKKFGWEHDPFSVRPSEKLVGLSKEMNEILNYIYSGSITLLTGPTGCGKTSVLLWIEKALQNSEYTPVKINCVEKFTKENIYTEITHSRSIKDKLSLKKFPKNTILLLDEAQYLQKDAGELIKVWWDDKKLYAVILASIKETLDNLTESFTDRLKGQIIHLPSLTVSQTSNLIKLRTSNKNPFENDAVEIITTRSEGIPRGVLELCRRTCMICAESDIFEINKSHISAFFPLPKREDTAYQKRQETKTKPLTPKRRETKETKIKRDVSCSLSPAQAEIINFLKREELSAEQIASLLGTSVGSIRKQISRLRGKNIVTIADFTKRPITYRLSEDHMRKSMEE